MPDEPKHSWWKSLPGILTAATGFVAALSGLVAGLNQLHLFKPPEPAGPVGIRAPLPRESLPQQPGSAASGGSSSSAAPSAQPTVAAPVSSARPAPAASTGHADPPRLPTGTTLELAVAARACARSNGQQRFTARLVAPVRVGGSTLLPANTPAVLRLRRDGSSAAPAVRLDSLLAQDGAVAVTSSTARVRRGAAGGECLRADARLTVTLTAAVTLGRR